MNPLNCIWQPVTVEASRYAHVTTPPLGKPDPELKRIPGYVRRRVFQKAQVGPTCMYYAARRISPHFGKKDDTFMRVNEMIISCFRKYLSNIKMLDFMPLPEEQKTFFITFFISYLGMHFHFPYETFCYNVMMWNWFLRPQIPVPEGATIVSVDPFACKHMWDTFQNKLRAMSAFSLKLMLLRMHIKPLNWRPKNGPVGLIKALRVHLYLFCIGDLGAHVFYYQKAVDYHPALGHIYSGPLKPLERPSAKFFSLHAIIVIGIRSTGFMKGQVYFIDPQDPSGPGLLQKVYVISLKDFFYRIKDSAGQGDYHSMTKEFVWAGNPHLFLT